MMNKKQFIIGGILIAVLTFFGTKSYLTIEKQNAKYETLENQSKQTSAKYVDKEKQTKQQNFDGQKVFTYSSSFYDIERSNGSVITKNELTYHTFDFNKKTVTQSSLLNGRRINTIYPFNEMYEEKGLLATTYVLTVNTLGVQEIWWSPDVPNLGYDYDDGTRIACYDLKIKK